MRNACAPRINPWLCLAPFGSGRMTGPLIPSSSDDEFDDESSFPPWLPLFPLPASAPFFLGVFGRFLGGGRNPSESPVRPSGVFARAFSERRRKQQQRQRRKWQ